MSSDLEEILNFFREVDTISADLSREILPRMPRFSKCYIRNRINPFIYYSDQEFKQRYRFSKNTVNQIILPEIFDLESLSNRGLPISIDTQLLIALRFYATGSFQVSTLIMFFIIDNFYQVQKN